VKLAIAFPDHVPGPSPKAIHARPCKHCPSAIGEKLGQHDEEATDYKAAPRDVQLESAFPCGWRPEKLCKGYCDFLGITERDMEVES
jgi:hypothetical protein